MIRTRHVRLEDAFIELETSRVTTVEIPEGMNRNYYQKYAHTKAGREGMKIRTGLRMKAGKFQLLMLLKG